MLRRRRIEENAAQVDGKIAVGTDADLFCNDLDAVAERLEERARAESLGKNWAKVVQQE